MFADGIRDRFPHFIGGDAVFEEPIDLLLQGFFDLRFILRRESYVCIDRARLREERGFSTNGVSKSLFLANGIKESAAKARYDILQHDESIAFIARTLNAWISIHQSRLLPGRVFYSFF